MNQQPQSWLDRGLRSLAHRTTHGIALLWGQRLGFWYVTEFPKSGGTWVGRMLGDSLGLPFPQASRMPIAMPAVVHNHWSYNHRLKRVVYVYRDGRDALVSLFFHRLYLDRPHRRGPYGLRRARRQDPDAVDVRRALPAFLTLEFQRPSATSLPWNEHVMCWLGDREGVAAVSYEGLLADPEAEMATVLRALGVSVEEARLRESIARHTFERLSGRPRGQEDRRSFLRKGEPGDWRTYFTREAAEVFASFAGSTLQALGYERDSSWVSACAPLERETGR